VTRVFNASSFDIEVPAGTRNPQPGDVVRVAPRIEGPLRPGHARVKRDVDGDAGWIGVAEGDFVFVAIAIGENVFRRSA
jgi:hypothetical protein